ncbi:type II toxin-antitoxin system HipA family toxin [Nostocoides veronense]|uniref:type II toxin-antitoxin system HipA family toxin n=1 Tax=Nostocoides veronense TaxID=330836 RepID=UPI003CD08975
MSFADLLATQGIGDPSALAGVQDKVSGRMLSVPLAYGGQGHLLKFEVPDFPSMVENEAYFLGVARRLRHPVAQARVVHDRDARSGLLVPRFDRRALNDGTLERVAVEDGAQVLGLHPADKYRVTLEELARGLSQVCRSRPLALVAGLRQAVLAWVTGNGDLHAKNISTLGSVNREIAPVYYVPSSLAYGDHTFALSLNFMAAETTSAARLFMHSGQRSACRPPWLSRKCSPQRNPSPQTSPRVPSRGMSADAGTPCGRCVVAAAICCPARVDRTHPRCLRTRASWASRARAQVTSVTSEVIRPERATARTAGALAPTPLPSSTLARA